MFEIGQLVRIGNASYEIIEVSNEPYYVFPDGSKHYVMTLKNVIGDYGDFIIINDSQIHSQQIEKEK